MIYHGRDAEYFNTWDVARLCEVKQRKIEGWLTRGVLYAMNPNVGTGRKRNISFREYVIALGIVMVQRKLGDIFEPGQLAQLLRDSEFPMTGYIALGSRKRTRLVIDVTKEF